MEDDPANWYREDAFLSAELADQTIDCPQQELLNRLRASVYLED